MNKVQENLLGLLQEIDDICQKYDIEYYLGGGTLVGAIRHGGFLPWDDDADIHMSRENAYKFIEAVKAEGLNDRAVYMTGLNCDYRYSLGRYLNTSSTCLLRGMVGQIAPQGQFVDIFVNYPLPNDEEEKKKCIETFRLYCELRQKNSSIDSSKLDENFLKRYQRIKRMEKIFGTNLILKFLEHKMYNFSEEDAEEWFLRCYKPPKIRTPKSLWGKPKYVKFEDTKLLVAEKPEKLLCYEYGPDWYEVPKHIDRGEHTFIIDLEVPYNMYTKEYEKYLNTKKFYSYEVKKKEYWFSLLNDRNIVNRHIHKLHGKQIVMEIQQNIERSGIDLMKMLKEGRKKELAEIFSSYFDFIGSSSVRYYGLYIDMPDEYLYAALYFSCFDGNYGIARKVLGKRRELIERPLSEDLQRLCDICDATDELLTKLYGDLDYTAAEEIADHWLKQYPDLLYFMRAKIFLSLQRENINALQLLEQCNSFLNYYENDGELLKYKGDLLLRQGKTQEAEDCYRKALNTLRNGYCITAIKEYFKAEKAV